MARAEDLTQKEVQFQNLHQTLSDVVAWVASLGKQDMLSDIVTQDEFTHDVIIRFTEHAYLVCDVT